MHQIRHAIEFLRQGFRYGDSVFHPSGLLDISVLLHMLRIVRMVIKESHCADAVESLHQHSLRIEISKAERAYYLCHSMFASEGGDRIQKCAGHLHVVDEVDPSESDLLHTPGLVCLVVDDCSHSAYDFSVLICKVKFRF